MITTVAYACYAGLYDSSVFAYLHIMHVGH